MGNSENITYEDVQRGVCEILREAMKMEEIFNSVTGSMNTMTDEENFEGSARNELSAQFTPFAAKFKEYVEQVERFAQGFGIAKDNLEETERRLQQMATEL